MKNFLVLLVVMAFFSACKYEYIKVEELPPIDDTVVISFATDILPILTEHNCVACHSTGKTVPDLTAANAYQSLIGGGFVVANNPEASGFYTFPNPTATTHRWEVFSRHQAELIFAWINQGANNN